MSTTIEPKLSGRQVDSNTFLDALHYYENRDFHWCPENVTVTDHVVIYNCHVRCGISLKGFNFEGGLSIQQSTFKSFLDFAEAELGNLEIRDSTIDCLIINGPVAGRKYTFSSVAVDLLGINTKRYPFTVFVEGPFEIRNLRLGTRKESLVRLTFQGGAVTFGSAEC